MNTVVIVVLMYTAIAGALIFAHDDNPEKIYVDSPNGRVECVVNDNAYNELECYFGSYRK